MIAALRTTGVRTHVVPRGVVSALTRSTSRIIRRVCLATALLVTIAAVAQPVHAAGGGQEKLTGSLLDFALVQRYRSSFSLGPVNKSVRSVPSEGSSASSCHEW